MTSPLELAGPQARSAVPILIVDDNPAKRLSLKAVLSPLGYSIVEAGSGLAALRCVAAQDFAVILLDIRMPNMDGFETAAHIRQRRQSEMTPIIFITAHAKDEVVNSDLYVEGAVDVIFPPVPPKELRAKVSVFANLFLRAKDLAERARVVQASADQLRLLSDAAPIGMFQTDSQNRYVYTNPRWTEITGIPAEEAAGRRWDTIVDADERARLVAGLPEGATDWSELSHRFEIQLPSSASRIVLVTSKAIPDNDGGVTGWVGTLANVTAEAGAEAAMSDARDKATEASRLKSDFLANMSHEIRTPMNGVIGMTELLLETDLDARQRDYAQTVRSSGEALLTIISDILDFSKVEAGKLEVEEIAFGVRTIVDDVVDLLAGAARSKGLELAAVIESSIPALVCGDPGRVRQVLTNFVGNAVKFTQSGKIVIRVTRDEVEGAAAVVRFEVSDTGDGIAPDKLALIFEPFVQADTSTSRKYGGTGLGLAISEQLVELMGGDCGVSSRLGEGSTFWFTISARAAAGKATHDQLSPDAGLDRVVAEEPVRVSATRSTNGSAVTGPRPAGQGSSGQILLAEDSEVNQLVATAMLENLGFQVDLVTDGAEAVKAASLTRYQAILMDCQMPVLDGYEATSEIRRRQGGSSRTPIIAVTASAMKSDRERCLAAGMDDYLTKPLRLNVLAAMLARWAADGPDPTVAVDPAEARPATHVPAADAAEPHGPALDAKVVDRLERLGNAQGEDFMQRLGILFLAEADARVVALREALDADDAAAIAGSAHTLRGASANVGATGLARLCATLETESAAGDLIGGGALLEAVEVELGRVRVALGSLTPTP